MIPARVQSFGRPHEVATAAAVLTSDDASVITGVRLMVDGSGSLVDHD